MPHLTAALALGASALGSLLFGLARRGLARGSDPGMPGRFDVGSAAELLAAELADRVDAAFAAVYLAETDGRPGLVATSSNAPLTIPPAPALVRRALTGRRFVSASRSELAELRRGGLEAPDGFAVPLLVGRQAVGVLLAVAPRGGWRQPVPTREAAYAKLAAAVLGLAEQAARCEDEASRDVLTALPNRRAFEQQFELMRDRERPAEATLALLDLDRFKSVNDSHGHPAGDRVLVRAAEVILHELRAGDGVFRLGGDEFALLIDGDAQAAEAVLGRIRSSFCVAKPPLPTFSGGIARVGAYTREEVLRRADDALYRAKARGRDCVVVYERPPIVAEPLSARLRGSSIRVLVIDDDPQLRALLRTTLQLERIDVAEAESAEAAQRVLRRFHPSLIVLDIGMPRLDGLSFCAELRRDPRTASIPVVLLSGLGAEAEARAGEVGADAFLHKPFSPLELLAIVERTVGEGPLAQPPPARTDSQLLAYATDLRALLELGMQQQSLLRSAYRQTVSAFATALESKDPGTRAHSDRVVSYASRLALAVAPTLLDDPSLEYGFLLHDVGKIGVADGILQKPGPLTPAERRAVERHTLLGAEMLAGVPLIEGEGIKVVRSHHERWDGTGYPDELATDRIPIGARVFAVADTLDAMTSARPYRPACDWRYAVETIRSEAGKQFDPAVVERLDEHEDELRETFVSFRPARERAAQVVVADPPS
jgi:diguanylate cyclase (GGDEF)-like protein